MPSSDIELGIKIVLVQHYNWSCFEHVFGKNSPKMGLWFKPPKLFPWQPVGCYITLTLQINLYYVPTIHMLQKYVLYMGAWNIVFAL